jgi:PleD family two-component response regulator
MLTNAATNAEHIRPFSAAPQAQKVVIVNGNAAILGLLEKVLEAGHYDVVFVEPSTHAYSQIKRVQPNLVILCLNLDDLESIHVLSMLKLDVATRDIPVLTYTMTSEDEEPGEEMTEPGEPEMMFTPKPAAWMN